MQKQIVKASFWEALVTLGLSAFVWVTMNVFWAFIFILINLVIGALVAYRVHSLPWVLKSFTSLALAVVFCIVSDIGLMTFEGLTGTMGTGHENTISLKCMDIMPEQLIEDGTFEPDHNEKAQACIDMNIEVVGNYRTVSASTNDFLNLFSGHSSWVVTLSAFIVARVLMFISWFFIYRD